MKKYVYVIAMFALCVIGMSSANAATVIKVNGEDTDCVDLFAGQTIVAGDVCFAADYDSNTLTIQFNPDMTQGWTLEETQLWIGTDLADMPQTKKGNPVPGNFPYKNADGVYVLDLTGLGFVCPGPYTLLVAAHAAMARVVDGEVVQTETGWSAGDRFVQKGNWGTYTAITLTCVEEGDDDPLEDPDPTCETAYAYDDEMSSTFKSLGLSNNWGWTNELPGPGTYTFDIWAAAGNNVLANGTLVGTLTVVYNVGSVSATPSMVDDFVVDDFHFYAGQDIAPNDNKGDYTVAPGQLQILLDEMDGGPIYIIYHAVVCGYYD